MYHCMASHTCMSETLRLCISTCHASSSPCKPAFCFWGIFLLKGNASESRLLCRQATQAKNARNRAGLPNNTQKCPKHTRKRAGESQTSVNLLVCLHSGKFTTILENFGQPGTHLKINTSGNFGELRGTSGNFGELGETSGNFGELRGTSGNFGELRVCLQN